jgi:hypothetical protein
MLCNRHFHVSRSLQVGVKGLCPRKLHCMWRVDGRGGELGGYDAVGSDQQSRGFGGWEYFLPALYVSDLDVSDDAQGYPGYWLATQRPAELAPLDAITAAIAGLDWREIAPRAVQRQRQMVIAASRELTERELIKLNALTAAFANGLQRRGTEEATALLAAQTGLTVYRTAYRRWLDADTETEIGHIIDAVLADLRAIVTA